MKGDRRDCRPRAAASRTSASNVLVAFILEGYTEDVIIIPSDREGRRASIHIEEYEVDARTTKLGDEEIKDIPNRSEESLRNLDDRGIVRIGAEVGSGDLLVGKVTPKGETELTAEEKLIRAIFKEKARWRSATPRSRCRTARAASASSTSRPLARQRRRSAARGHDLVRVYVAKKRKIAEGDKLAGRHGNKGVISKIVAEQDMPFLEDGTPVDVILNPPLGVPSRMNLGQILEAHLGWVAGNGWYDDDLEACEAQKDSGRVYVATPVFDGATVEDVDEALCKWSEEHAAERASPSTSTPRSGLDGAARARPRSTTAARASRTRRRSPSATCTS